ncbi:mas-related G-protein coupled receptor member H-like [Haemorhous mexicanus]|uniref:mas-related G-protein coupled receptor member H-like n=1 Tax=Haemorhous mexicanus TaxID=30427 RepID=UPI0028BE176B|nr:mas-related G-protein coupled receptor member H-like [Haemorhous mexicanus]
MEVTTVSPPATSPTEGDDLCNTDVTTMVTHSVTLLICLCGLAGNGAVLCLLSLKKSGNAGIFDLAVMDFLILLFAVPSALLILVEDVSCSLIMPLMYMNFLFQLSVVSHYWALLWLMRSNKILFMREIWNLCCRCDLPEHLWWVLDSAQYWAFFALFTVIPSVTFLCPSHEQEHCRAAFISMYTLILLFLAAPLLISSTIDLINAKPGSQQQQPKRRDIVLFIILLLTLLLSLWNFLQQLSYITVSSQVVFLLTCIHSTIKPFIYFLVGRCRRPCSMWSLRLSLQRIFEEPKENNADSGDPAMDMGV